ncbi:MAG: M48 family metallopeptidase, partial [Fervidobacterium sp.]
LFTTLFFIFSSFQTLFGLSIIVRVIIKILNAKPLEAELLELEKLQKLNNKEGKSQSLTLLKDKKDKIEFVKIIFNNLKNEIGYAEDIELMIVDSSSVNAISLGRFKHSHKICLTKGSLEKLEERELRALLYHELFHIVNMDTDYLTTISGTFASPMLFFTLSKNTIKNLYKIKGKIRPSEYYKRFFLALLVLLISSLFLPLAFLTNIFVSVSKEFDADNFSLQKVGKDELLSLFEKVKLNCVSFESNYFFMKTLFFSHPNCKDLSKKMNRIFDTYPSLEERIELIKSKVSNVSNINTKDLT